MDPKYVLLERFNALFLIFQMQYTKLFSEKATTFLLAIGTCGIQQLATVRVLY